MRDTPPHRLPAKSAILLAWSGNQTSTFGHLSRDNSANLHDNQSQFSTDNSFIPFGLCGSFANSCVDNLFFTLFGTEFKSNGQFSQVSGLSSPSDNKRRPWIKYCLYDPHFLTSVGGINEDSNYTQAVLLGGDWPPDWQWQYRNKRRRISCAYRETHKESGSYLQRWLWMSLRLINLGC